MCTGCGGKEGILDSIRRWTVKIYEYWFSHVYIGQRRGRKRGRRHDFRHAEKSESDLLIIDGNIVVEEGGMYGNGIHFY